MTKIQSLLDAIRLTEKRTFTRREWSRLINSIAKTKEEAVYLRGYFMEHKLAEFVVKITPKATARIKE